MEVSEEDLTKDRRDKSENAQNNPNICFLFIIDFEREHGISAFLQTHIFDMSLISCAETLSNLTRCLISKTHMLTKENSDLIRDN